MTETQISNSIEYAVSLRMPRDKIYYVEYDCTGYGVSFDILRLGTDLYPSIKKQKNPNSNLSMKGVIAHEIIGHRNASLKGLSQTDDLLEGVQASLRAVKLAFGLNKGERIILIRDGLSRSHKNNLRADVPHLLGGGSHLRVSVGVIISH